MPVAAARTMEVVIRSEFRWEWFKLHGYGLLVVELEQLGSNRAILGFEKFTERGYFLGIRRKEIVEYLGKLAERLADLLKVRRKMLVGEELQEMIHFVTDLVLSWYLAST